jgi:hypothetical protein
MGIVFNDMLLSVKSLNIIKIILKYEIPFGVASRGALYSEYTILSLIH